MEAPEVGDAAFWTALGTVAVAVAGIVGALIASRQAQHNQDSQAEAQMVLAMTAPYAALVEQQKVQVERLGQLNGLVERLERRVRCLEEQVDSLSNDRHSLAEYVIALLDAWPPTHLPHPPVPDHLVRLLRRRRANTTTTED
jgi:hypothetical protein